MATTIVDTGTWVINLIHPTVIQRGQTSRFKASFKHVKDGFVDLTTPTLKFYDGTDTQVSTTQTPNQTDLGKGEYKKDFTFSNTLATGTYVAEWGGTYTDTDGIASTIFIRQTFIIKSGKA